MIDKSNLEKILILMQDGRLSDAHSISFVTGVKRSTVNAILSRNFKFIKVCKNGNGSTPAMYALTDSGIAKAESIVIKYSPSKIKMDERVVEVLLKFYFLTTVRRVVY